MRFTIILLFAWTMSFQQGENTAVEPGRRITGPGTTALQAHDAKSAVLYENIRVRPLDGFIRGNLTFRDSAV